MGPCLAILFCATFSLEAQETVKSPVNGRPLIAGEAGQSYSFLIAGHLYGSPVSRSAYPAASVLANIDRINDAGARFFVSLGDGYRIPSLLHIRNFRNALTKKLDVPVFVTPGNHEISDQSSRELYVQEFGETIYHFSHGRELFIFLDSELDRGRIEGNQLRFLSGLIENAIDNPEIASVFIFSHKLIWAVDDPYFQPVYDQLNSPFGYDASGSFGQDVEPLVEALAKQKNVYWCSGDIGVKHPLFFDAAHSGVTYVATGVADNEDALIEVRVSGSSGHVRFLSFPLGEQSAEPLERFDTAHWMRLNPVQRSTMAEKLYGRLETLLSHRYYWSGVATSAIGLALAVALFTRQKS